MAMSDDLTGALERFVPRELYPDMHEHALAHMREGAHHDVSAFDLGLGLFRIARPARGGRAEQGRCARTPTANIGASTRRRAS